MLEERSSNVNFRILYYLCSSWTFCISNIIDYIMRFSLSLKSSLYTMPGSVTFYCDWCSSFRKSLNWYVLYFSREWCLRKKIIKAKFRIPNINLSMYDFPTGWFTIWAMESELPLYTLDIFCWRFLRGAKSRRLWQDLGRIWPARRDWKLCCVSDCL